MAQIELRGVPVLYTGEWITLARGMKPGRQCPRTLTALSVGDERGVTPELLIEDLTIGVRIHTATDQARQMVDRAVARLRAAFPDELPRYEDDE